MSITKVKPCPICGAMPKASVVQSHYSERKEYKLNCSNHPLHISCGNWFNSIEKARKDWNKRCTGYGQPEFYHATNEDIVKEETANRDGEELASYLIEITKGRDKKQLNEWLGKREEYPCCKDCEQHGQEYCVCKYVRYGKYKAEGYED